MNVFTAVLDVFFPPRCVFCHELLPLRREGEVCPRCQKSLERFRGEEKAEFVERVVAPFRYKDAVRDSIHRYKFGGREFYAKTYAQYMAEALRDAHAEFDLLSYVPLHPRRKRSRGYDQAQLLAEELGKLLDAEPKPLLRKTRNVSPQSGISDAARRRANISGCYELLPGVSVTEKRILLVDDVFTSGATLSECARMLLMAEAEEVSAVTVATAHKG